MEGRGRCAESTAPCAARAAHKEIKRGRGGHAGVRPNDKPFAGSSRKGAAAAQAAGLTPPG